RLNGAEVKLGEMCSVAGAMRNPDSLHLFAPTQATLACTSWRATVLQCGVLLPRRTNAEHHSHHQFQTPFRTSSKSLAQSSSGTHRFYTLALPPLATL